MDQPWAIALDSTHVYWTTLPGGSATRGTVVAAPLMGGSNTTLATGLSLPNAIATDGTNLYWADDAQGVVAVNVAAGGAARTLAHGLAAIDSIAVSGESVYVNPGGSVVRVPLDGGASQVVVADAGAGSLAAGPDAVYWGWGTPQDDGGAVFSAPLDGGTPKRLASLPSFPVTLALDDGTVFCTVFDEYVLSVPVDGGAPTTIAGSAMYGLAVDSTYVYWSTQDGVMRAPRGGGPPTTLAKGSAEPGFMAVDDAGLYWTTFQIAPCATDPETAGAVMRAPLSR